VVWESGGRKKSTATLYRRREKTGAKSGQGKKEGDDRASKLGQFRGKKGKRGKKAHPP